jgi:hypothetical protein
VSAAEENEKYKLTRAKSGINGLLDVARQTYKEANMDVYQLVDELIGK